MSDTYSYLPQSRSVRETGFNGLPAYVPSRQRRSSTEFQQALQHFLQPQRRPRPQSPEATVELLTINPNLNLKLISSLHPGAGLVQENGHTRLEIPLPQLDQVGMQAHSVAVRQAASLEALERKQPQALDQVLAEDRQDYAFGKVVASNGLAAVLMGQGIQSSRSVNPQNLQALLQTAVPAKAVDASEASARAGNDYSHWRFGV